MSAFLADTVSPSDRRALDEDGDEDGDEIVL